MKQKNAQIRHCLEGEIPSQYWSQANKDRKLRDLMYALKKPDYTENEHGVLSGEAYEKNSQKMAKMACEYHDSL